MDSPEKIRAQLRRGVPAEVNQDVVLALAEHWFRGYWHRAPTGSHFCIIEHEWLRFLPSTSDGTLSISAHKGKVKRVWVERLLKAIEVVEEGRRQGVTEPPPRKR